MDKFKQRFSQEEKNRLEKLANGYTKFAQSEIGQDYQQKLRDHIDGFMHQAYNAKTADEAMAASKCAAGVQLAINTIQDMQNLKK